MNRDDELQKTFADICVLFELTLSIGQSLDLHDNCERFLTTLMARKDLGFASVWLFDDLLDGPRPEGEPWRERGLRLVRGVPLAHVRETEVPATHCAFVGVGEAPLSFSTSAKQRLIETGLNDGTCAVFPLRSLGFLRLFSAAPSRLDDPVELSQLETVVRKFAGSIEGCLAHRRVMSEVARRERLERERQAMQQQLEHAHKMEAIGRLAGGVAHDFNNLLTVIRGHADLLARRASGTDGRTTPIADTKSDIDAIASASERAADLTGQLLAFSRRGKLRKVPVEIDQLVQEAIALISRTRDPNVVLTFDGGAAGARVLGDASLLQGVIINLLVNACDAMPDGGCIAVTTGRPSEAGVRIAVRDTGVGMSAEVQQRVFEPFFTTKALGRGTGLGLSVAYGTVQSHGGTIAVDSTVGGGTTFTIDLPIAASSGPSPSWSTQQETIGQGEAILIVDDQDEVRAIMGVIVGGAGYTPLMAGDGLAAVALLDRERSRIRAVLLDVRMPRMDGVETLRRLRERDAALPVIIVSGFGADRDLDLMRSLGVQGEIEKPFSARDLLAALADGLAGARARSGSP